MDELTELIGSIYDAALDPATWNDVLTKIGQYLGAGAVGLLSKDSLSNRANAHYHVGVDPHYMRLYQEKYSKFDPMATLPFLDVGQIVNTPDLVPYEEFRQGRFYREWAQPQGWIDVANAVLEKSATSCAYLSVIRNEQQGMVDDEMRRRMELIVPHVRRAVLIGKVIDLKHAEAATFADVADGINAGMFLVDATARIVHANATGHLALSAGDPLRTVGGRLAAVNPQVDQSLREICADAGSGDSALGTKGVAMPMTTRAGQYHVVHVLPLTGGERRHAGMMYAAVAAVFIRRAGLEAPSMPEVIAKSYALTPTELRVLLSVVDVGGVPEVAASLGIAETTVRTHLGRVFEKTGTRRQADLVKLAAGFACPLVA